MEQSVKVYRQNRSDEQQRQQKSKSKESAGSNTAYKRQRDNSNDPSYSNGPTSKDAKKNLTKLNDIQAVDANQYGAEAALSGSRITQGAGAISSETGLSNHGQATTSGTAVARHLSNKSDTNLNGHSAQTNTIGVPNVGRPGQRQASEGRKKRKNSDKQRKTSNNRRGEKQQQQHEEKNGLFIPPIDHGNSGAPSQSMGSVPSHQRSHSRGATGSQNSQLPGGLNVDPMGQAKENNFLPSQFFDQASFNPFTSNLSQNSQQSTFNMAMAGQGGFPFNNAGPNGPYNQQVPQVHFIAKKQQFIAQISPEQLMNGDKRPYTAQSLNNLSANAKRAGSVYAGTMGKNNNYNLANAHFTNQPVYFGNIGARTHTNGFSFHPPGGGPLSKYAHSVYGDDVKPKVAGKDILKALGSSNGFNTDPYNSIMSSGLPSSITHSGKHTKSKMQGSRHLTKEKEQLYDETIKMKMLNNSLKEDHVKLKTKIKILENELSRKEKTIEELFSHNQLIQNNQKGGSGQNQSMMPMAQTAQKYQQETFLVMSLKKQIRELKYEVVKRDEELEVLRKNIKNTRTKELEQEIATYHMECLRLRQVMEELIKEGQNHPLHQQAFMERVNHMQMEMQQKDMVIKQLSESLQKQEALSSNAAINNQSTSLAGVRSQDSQSFETHPSDMQVQHHLSAVTANREKSLERKHPLNTAHKDMQKEIAKGKKQLREKEKELVKLRGEITQMRRESSDKAKNDIMHNKDSEVQLKNLKDKVRDFKNEIKRKDERLSETDSKARKLEETVKSLQDQVKTFETNTKSLKNQLRAAKHQAQQAASSGQKTEPKEQVKTENSPSKSQPSVSAAPKEESKPKPPKDEIATVTLIGQREKLCRDDLTAMMLAGEESLRILIREPSSQLIDFIKANLQDEDTILAAIPRFEMPKADFEAQVLREMRIVLKENTENIVKLSEKELMEWTDFEKFYLSLENFDYPHKDKLLEFIKYFFLDHIISEKKIMMNYLAFKEHMLSTRAIGGNAESAEKSRNNSNLRSRRKSQDSTSGLDDSVKRLLLAGGSEDEKADEERMLDIAEQCFMRVADLLHILQKTVRQVFLRYSQPEAFKDGSILELMSPSGFLEGVRDIGFDDITELEAACLMKVLAKPELDNAVILNEFVLIMENFGVPAISEEEEYENDYIPDSDEETDKKEEPKPEAEEKKEEGKEGAQEMQDKHKKFVETKSKEKKHPITIKFDSLEEKGMKIMKKLARFLLERYMHPREFFGPTIKKEVIGKKKCKVEIIKLHDFYLRLKLASIRKKLKENVSLNTFLAIDGDKYPGFIQVKRMIKALEVVAEGEQELMIKEQEEKEKADKERILKLIEDRKTQGLPPYTDEELEALRQPEEAKRKAAAAEEKKKLEAEKEKKGGMSEILKLGEGKSPKTKEKAKFASHLGVQMELNTIEEDLHETQTSHYSYQLKEGEGSERDSRHHLSTSNHFKGNELEDSNNLSRRSETGAKDRLPLGVSVNSGDYSGGSHSSTKKANRLPHDLEVNDMDIQINDFKQVKVSKRSSQPVIKEENHEEETTPAAASSRKITSKDLEENEQDRLDKEVEKKLEKLHESKGEKSDDEEDYEDDEDFNEMKEDTIKTDQIEQLVEDDLKKDKLDKEGELDGIEEYSYKDEETKSDGKQKKEDEQSEDDYEF